MTQLEKEKVFIQSAINAMPQYTIDNVTRQHMVSTIRELMYMIDLQWNDDNHYQHLLDAWKLRL